MQDNLQPECYTHITEVMPGLTSSLQALERRQKTILDGKAAIAAMRRGRQVTAEGKGAAALQQARQALAACSAQQKEQLLQALQAAVQKGA
jgi:hypothetical protein